MPAPAVLDNDARLRRQRLELFRRLARVVAEGTAGVEMGEQQLERPHLRPQPQITRLRLRTNALEPRLHMVAVRHEQLQLELLEVAGGVGARREAVGRAQERVDTPEVPEQRGADAGDVLHADRGRRGLRRALQVRDRSEAFVGNLRHADVLLRIVDRGSSVGQSIEERGLSRPRQADDPDLEAHAILGRAEADVRLARVALDVQHAPEHDEKHAVFPAQLADRVVSRAQRLVERVRVLHGNAHREHVAALEPDLDADDGLRHS